MERKFFHGLIKPSDVAQTLMAEFDQGNLHTQAVGNSDKMIVQVGTRPGAMSGGKTALTVTIQAVEDGIMVELGEQAWLGVAASLGVSALATLRNPLNLLGRLDDIAQDIENLQLTERLWKAIDKSVHAAGASLQLSDRLSRAICDYCWTANPLGESACIACGAPLGKSHPTTCPNCGFAVKLTEISCPNCSQPL